MTTEMTIIVTMKDTAQQMECLLHLLPVQSPLPLPLLPPPAAAFIEYLEEIVQTESCYNYRVVITLKIKLIPTTKSVLSCIDVYEVMN